MHSHVVVLRFGTDCHRCDLMPTLNAASAGRGNTKRPKGDYCPSGTVLAPAHTMDNPAAAREMGPPSAEPEQWKHAVFELAEARLRYLVAARLGIDATQVRMDASLVDDLGADEVDLLEIAVALEEEFGLVIPDAVLGHVRTYGDFSAALPVLLKNLADSDAAGLLASGSVRVRVIRNPPEEAGATLRAARLTPRVIEGIVEEVLCTAGVTRLELTCSEDTTDSQLALIAQQFGLAPHSRLAGKCAAIGTGHPGRFQRDLSRWWGHPVTAQHQVCSPCRGRTVRRWRHRTCRVVHTMPSPTHHG